MRLYAALAALVLLPAAAEAQAPPTGPRGGATAHVAAMPGWPADAPTVELPAPYQQARRPRYHGWRVVARLTGLYLARERREVFASLAICTAQAAQAEARAELERERSITRTSGAARADTRYASGEDIVDTTAEIKLITRVLRKHGVRPLPCSEFAVPLACLVEHECPPGGSNEYVVAWAYNHAIEYAAALFRGEDFAALEAAALDNGHAKSVELRKKLGGLAIEAARPEEIEEARALAEKLAATLPR